MSSSARRGRRRRKLGPTPATGRPEPFEGLAVAEAAGLVGVLERARELGMLGPGPVEDHVAHALGFAEIVTDQTGSGALLDLGSGGGVPGLIVALAHPEATLDLLDGRQQRVAFLHSAVAELGLADRVRIIASRAEDAAHQQWRGGYVAVMARGFGAPAVTAECGAAFLRRGGLLVVSEPPSHPEPAGTLEGQCEPARTERWPEAGLALIGLRLADRRVAAGASFVVLEAVAECPDRLPRRVGIPSKRPLF